MQKVSSIILYLSIVVVALSGAALAYMMIVDAPSKKIEAAAPTPAPRVNAALPAPAAPAPAQQPAPATASTSASAPTSASTSAREPEREYRPVWIAPTTKYRESALPPATPDRAGEPAAPAQGLPADETAEGETPSIEASVEARNRPIDRIQERPHNLEAETPEPPPPPPPTARPRVNFESPFHRDSAQ